MFYVYYPWRHVVDPFSIEKMHINNFCQKNLVFSIILKAYEGYFYITRPVVFPFQFLVYLGSHGKEGLPLMENLHVWFVHVHVSWSSRSCFRSGVGKQFFLVKSIVLVGKLVTWEGPQLLLANVKNASGSIGIFWNSFALILILKRANFFYPPASLPKHSDMTCNIFSYRSKCWWRVE